MFVACLQMILHYLGIAGIILGIIALLYSNSERGIQLIIGGVAFIVIKYLIGFIYLTIVGQNIKNQDKNNKS